MENGASSGRTVSGISGWVTHRQLGLSLPLLLGSEALLFSSLRPAPLLGTEKNLGRGVQGPSPTSHPYPEEINSGDVQV